MGDSRRKQRIPRHFCLSAGILRELCGSSSDLIASRGPGLFVLGVNARCGRRNDVQQDYRVIPSAPRGEFIVPRRYSGAFDHLSPLIRVFIYEARA